MRSKGSIHSKSRGRYRCWSPVATMTVLSCVLLWSCSTARPSSEEDRRRASEATSEAQAGDTTARSEASKKASKSAESGESAGMKRVEGPDGEFSVPVPQNWATTLDEGYRVVSVPNVDLAVYLTALGETDPEAAISKAWERVGIDQTFDVGNKASPPAEEPFEGLTVITYELSSKQRFRQAVARRRGDRTYVTLIDGPLVDVQKRNSQIQVIDSGLRVEGADVSTLEGVSPGAWDPSVQEALSTHIREKMKAFGIPGVAIGVVKDGRVVWKRGFGKRKEGGAESVTAATRMMIGSTTKTMTAMLMAQAVDSGRFEWKTPAADVLPQFKLNTSELTGRVQMRHLLCACTGIPRRDLEILMNYRELSAEDVVEQLATFEPFTEFGTAYQYSNQMVATGGYATAAAYTGTWGELLPAYESTMEKKVFGPIGMKSTTLRFDRAVSASNHATPHGMTLEGTYDPIDVSLERFTVPLAPAGAVWSTVDDMTRYLRTQLSGGVAPGGTRVVSEKNLEKTWEPQVKISDQASYGLGWIVSDLRGKRVIGHNGNTMGFTSNLAFIPSDDLGIVILANAWGANSFSESVRARLFELLYDADLKAVENASYAREQTTKEFKSLRERLTSVDEAAVKPFIGTWTNDSLGRLEVRWEDGDLIYDVGEFSAELLPLKPEDGEADESSATMTFLTVKPQVGGTLRFETTDDGVRISFGKGTTKYTFEPVDDG